MISICEIHLDPSVYGKMCFWHVACSIISYNSLMLGILNHMELALRGSIRALIIHSIFSIISNAIFLENRKEFEIISNFHIIFNRQKLVWKFIVLLVFLVETRILLSVKGVSRLFVLHM